jgi:hypothetical protein
MNWLERSTSSRLRFTSECRRFVIVADDPSDGRMPWWVAKFAAGKHVAAGYGDDGLAKCKRYCEIAAAEPVEQHVEPVIAECQRVVIQASSSLLAKRAPQASLF